MTSASLPASVETRAALWPWLLLAAVLVVFRTLPYAWWGTLAFDGDQAVVGLMAKHIAEFRAFPVYQYALQYVVMVSAYVTAPFMWVFGPTLFALKLPLLLMNVACGVGLVAAVVRTGLRPAVAVVLCLPVLLTSGVTNAGLMDALGMTVEPLVFVLALWATRRAPVAFGIVAALGFHVREFVAYGVAAIVAIDIVSGVAFSREGRRHWLLVALVALGMTALIGGVARYASVRGPETFLASDGEGNLATLGGAFCFAPVQAWRNVIALGQDYLGWLWGAAPYPLSDAAVQSRLWQGLPGAWPLFGVMLVVAGLHIAWHWRTVWARRRMAGVQLGAFLAMVGAEAVLVYAVSRCGPLSVLTIRYALLGVFLPTGVALLAWHLEPRPALRYALGASFVALAVLNGWTHVRLWREQVARPPVTNRAQLARALEARGITHIRSDYWTAYYVAFLTQERIVVGADALPRVDAYERALAQHAGDVVRVSTEPCGEAAPIVPGYYLCRDSNP